MRVAGDLMGKLENTFSTNDAVCTPAAVYEPIIAALGPIGLDPFSNPSSTVPATLRIMLPQYAANRVAPGLWGFDPHGGSILWGSAYDHDWSGHGLVFANGPYSDCAMWAHQLWSPRGGDEAVGLFPVRTGADWWQRWVAHSDAILFWRGRIHFVGHPHQAPFHSALSYIGPRADLFVEGMQHLGWCVRNPRAW